MNPKESISGSHHPKSAGLAACAVVKFYQVWHGKLHLPGAGYLLRKASAYLQGLQQYPLEIKGIGTVPVDFRDHAGFLWLQHLLGDKLAAFDIEEGLFCALKNLLKEGSIFWDVGANLGTVSTYVVTQFSKVKVFSFEPNPDIYKSLEALFSRHPNVKVYPFALSDNDNEVVMTIPIGKSVGGSIEGLEYVMKTSSLKSSDVRQVSVKACKGDTLIAQNGALFPPNVIKIDVEGHEGSAIQGLHQTIVTHRPIIIFEHLYLSDAQIEALTPKGYSIHSIDNATGELSEAFSRDIGHNSILVPDSVSPNQ